MLSRLVFVPVPYIKVSVSYDRIPYRTNVWWEKSLAKMLQMSIWRKKFGEPTVYEEAIQGTWILFGDLSNFAKFAKLFSHQTFVLYGN